MFGRKKNKTPDPAYTESNIFGESFVSTPPPPPPDPPRIKFFCVTVLEQTQFNGQSHHHFVVGAMNHQEAVVEVFRSKLGNKNFHSLEVRCYEQHGSFVLNTQ